MTGDQTAFVHCYFGDLLCLPVCVPVTLWLQRRLGWRVDDRRPSGLELLLYWALWCGCFEWLGPMIPLLAPGAVADPWDVIAYGAGGLIGILVWRPAVHERGPCPATSGRMVMGRLLVAIGVAAFVLSAYRFGVVFR